MDISAPASDRSLWTIRVTSVRMRREDGSSISSHPLADLGAKQIVGLRHLRPPYLFSSFVRATRPFPRRQFMRWTKRLCPARWGGTEVLRQRRDEGGHRRLSGSDQRAVRRRWILTVTTSPETRRPVDGSAGDLRFGLLDKLPGEPECGGGPVGAERGGCKAGDRRQM